jgi:D-alanine-D-alanine ligase
MRTVGVFFGGQSAEHDVSIITAHTPIIETLATLPDTKVVPIFISKQGLWYTAPEMLSMDFFTKGDHEELLASKKPLAIELGNGSLALLEGGFFKKRVVIDLAFPAMHGTYGEDGSLMGLLRMAGIPFVGCDMATSAVAMDKVLTKQVLASEGIPIVPFVWGTRAEWNENTEALMARAAYLRYPLFVKPVHLGSSIGITKVREISKLKDALEVAFHYDEKVLIEEGIEPLVEITLPLMGDHVVGTALLERPLNKTEFFDFNDKYLSGGKKGQGGVNNAYSEIPASLPPDLTEKFVLLGKNVFAVLGASGILRVDFLMHADTHQIFVNEINTLPGSLYHHNWKKAGVSNRQLVETLIAIAEARAERTRATTFGFSSSILQKTGAKTA